MKITNTELERRKPLWCALSDMFLDNELQDCQHSSIAKKMRQSGYALTEIEDILMDEVFPACIWNLLSVAGDWAGFDEEWLVESILKRKKPNLIQNCFYKANFYLIKDDWLKVKALYKKEI